MNTRPESILLVEDDELVRGLLHAQLEALGYRVCSVADGAAALRALESGPIDLLMTDVVLPDGMDGYALAERVHAARPDVPVLFASGSAARENAAPRGAVSDHLDKPFRLTELEAMLRRLLEQARARRALRD